MSSRFLHVVCLVATLATFTSQSWAAGANDADVRALIRDIFDSEVAKESYQGALDNLNVAKVVCEGDACSEEVEAELLVAVGTVQALLGKKDDARSTFVEAIKLDPGAKLMSDYADGDVKAAWDKARGKVKKAEKEGCRGRFDGGDKPRGWLNAEAYFCYKEAKSAESEEDWDQCAEDAKASLELENRIGTRGTYARCLEAANKWTQAIEQYETLAREAPRQRQFNVGRRATIRAALLQRRMPAIVLEAPDDVEELSVKLDGTELPTEVLGSEIPIDPGEHEIVASGTDDGVPLGFEQTVDVEPNRTLTLLLTLTPGNPDPGTRTLLKCLASGKSPEDCLAKSGGAGSDLNYRIATEVSGYHDSMDVDVVSPSVSFNMEHVTQGWGVGASFLVDIVTAASTDILATASPRWQEVRYVPAINGHKKFGDFDVSLRGNLSREPDYLATSVGTNVSAELVQKTVVPSLGYEFSYDINGRKETPFSTFGLPIKRHAVNAGLGLVLTKATFGSIAYTMVFEDGDSSKPYRHIPMFSPEVAAGVPSGLVVDAVNFFREPERPLEQLPTSRKRFAVAFSVAHRFADATLRGSERLYADTWGTKATTTDARFMYDILKELRVWPHARFHAQTAASFYELAYSLERTEDGGVRIPAIRTGDRELGPMIAVTGGGGIRWDFGDRRNLGLTFNGDVVYTRFLNHLFVKERVGLFGALGFDAEFE